MAEDKGITNTELLSQINSAISAIAIGGAEYRIGSRMLRRADLKQLYQMRNELIAQIAADDQNGLLDNTYTAVFDGR